MPIIILMSFFLISFNGFAQAGAVGTLNQIKKDPAASEFKSEREDLRAVIEDLDEPRAKPKEKSPNEIQFEKEEQKKKQLKK